MIAYLILWLTLFSGIALSGCGPVYDDGSYEVDDPECIKGDLNYDGVTDGRDLNILGNALNWQIRGHMINIDDRCHRYDINKDGTVDGKDAEELAGML